MNDDLIRSILNRTREPRELGGALGVRQFHAAQMIGRSLWSELRCGASIPPDRIPSLRSTCGAIRNGLDSSYVLAQELEMHRTLQAGHHAEFLADFHRRLTYVGTATPPATWTHFGWLGDDPLWPLGLGRDCGHVILGAGIQGSGKTVLSTVLAEGSLWPCPPLTSAQLFPTSYAFFHIEEQDRLPQLLDGLKPNPTRADLDLLLLRLGVCGQGLLRVRLVVPETLLKDLWPRLLPYMDLGLEVRPLKVHLAQLGQPGLEAALGAESGSRYVQRILQDAQDQGQDLSIQRMRHFIDTAEDLNIKTRTSAHALLDVLAEVASAPQGPGLWDMYEPGVATVAYLGGPYVGQGRVLPLLVGLLHGLMRPSPVHGEFQRLIVVDEVNLLAQAEAAWRAFTRVGRLVRHLGSTLMLMGQDLQCVPDELFGLAGLCFVFQLRNPKVWEHIRDRVGALRDRRWEDVAVLPVGHAMLGATCTTDPRWAQASRWMRVRPLRCEHGGRTRAML